MSDLWDQRIAGLLVKPLVHTPITPNHLTTLSLLLSVSGALLFAGATPTAANWGAGLFMLGRFLDHFDGELARQSGKISRYGHIYDYVAGCVSYSVLFLALGVSLRNGLIGVWAIILGIVTAFITLIITLMAATLSSGSDKKTGDYPCFAGFELEDGIYLIGPIVWLGWVEPFFLLAALGTLLFGIWTGLRYLRTR